VVLVAAVCCLGHVKNIDGLIDVACVGMWREGSDGTDINACCRSNNQQLLASADDFGFVNLYEYPSSQPRVSCHLSQI